MPRYRLPGGGLTPNRKIVKSGNNFSPSNLKIAKQQPTTRNIFQYIKVSTNAASQTLSFFSNLNNSPFPLSNIASNKFNAGEALAVQRIYLSMMIATAGSNPPIITGLKDFDYAPETEKFYASLLNVFVDNNRLIKDLSVTSFKGQFNYMANFAGLTAAQPTAPAAFFTEGTSHCVFELDDVMTIPEQIEFTATLQIPPYPVAPFVADIYIGLTMEGLGALVSPKHNF